MILYLNQKRINKYHDFTFRSSIVFLIIWLLFILIQNDYYENDATNFTTQEAPRGLRMRSFHGFMTLILLR